MKSPNLQINFKAYISNPARFTSIRKDFFDFTDSRLALTSSAHTSYLPFTKYGQFRQEAMSLTMSRPLQPFTQKRHFSWARLKDVLRGSFTESPNTTPSETPPRPNSGPLGGDGIGTPSSSSNIGHEADIRIDTSDIYTQNHVGDAKDNSQSFKSGLGKLGSELQSHLMNSAKNIVKNQYLFNEELHDEVYIGMQILNSPQSLELINNEIDKVKETLIEFSDRVNPFDLTAHGLSKFNSDILDVVKTACPELSDVSEYLLTKPGKRFRPVLILLVNKLISESYQIADPQYEEIHQTRIIEVAELIHTASIMHDDVLDDADLRRGSDSTHKIFGNKKAILGGDFLLARACRISATFGIPEVCGRTSKIVESLVKGELIQGWGSHKSLESAFKIYLTKTYYKTAALMAEACACGALISGYPQHICEEAFKLGGLVGMAFQLYDDLIDYSVNSSKLGKPALNDIKSGVVTSPLFLSALENPEILIPIIKRKMNNKGDYDTILTHVYEGCAMPRAQLLVLLYIKNVIEILKNNSVSNGEYSNYSKGLATLLLKMLQFNIK